MAFPRRRLCIVAALLVSSATAAQQTAFDLPAIVAKPGGQGPFPAVIVMHDCSGLGPRSSGSPYRWQTRLVRAGYVVIEPDSFSTRGHPDGTCSDGSPPIVRFADRVRDAYATLDYAQSLPFVDGKRVAIMGGSHGGSTTLNVIAKGRIGVDRKAPGFAGAIALYPGCGRTIGDWQVTRDRERRDRIAGYAGVFRPRAPLLILIGELDDWTPAEPCRRLAEIARADGQPVELIVYPGVHHSFDSPLAVRFRAGRRNSNALGGHGATTGGDAAAWADAERRTLAFLKEWTAAAP